MKLIILLTTFSLFYTSVFAQKTYKEMEQDPSFNFYEVCKEANQYFESNPLQIKNTAWQNYQQWKAENESKYYPSGKRNNVSPLFAAKAYQKFLKRNPSTPNKNLFYNGWEKLGPFRVDNILQNYTPGIGQIEDLYVNPNNPNLMYIGSGGGGFWKTYNGGSTWQGSTTDFLPASGVNIIAVHPNNHNSILINIKNSYNDYSHGIYRSSNGGNSWTLTNFNPSRLGFGGLGSNFIIHTIAYNPSDPNLVLIGTNKGLFRSTNNLGSWRRILSNSDISQVAFHPTNSSIVYIYDQGSSGTNRNVVLYSTDRGRTFTASSTITGNNNKSGHLSVSAACANCLYFASDNGLWKSTNSGLNFTYRSNPPENFRSFAVSDRNDNYIIYGDNNLVNSSNNGAFWYQSAKGSLKHPLNGTSTYHNNFIYSTKYIHANLNVAKCVNGVFYVGTDGFVAKSTDNGNNWQKLNQGMAIRENYNLGVSQSNHYRTAVGSATNGTSIQYKNTWIESNGENGMEAIIHPLNDSLMITSQSFGKRFLSKDGGIHLQTIRQAGNSQLVDWKAPLAYKPNDHMTVFDFRERVYKSTNFGSTWQALGSPTSFAGAIQQAAIAENNSNIMVVSKFQFINKSIDGGQTFVDIKNNLPSHSIKDIAFDPSDDNTFIVVNDAYQNNNEKVYITTNGGTSWTNITYNLGNMPIHSVVIDHTPARNIYVGAEIGIYTKPMNGNTWVLYNPNLPNVAIKELEIIYGSNTLRAATWGRGLWEYALVGRANYPAIVTTKISNPPSSVAPGLAVSQWVSSTISYAQIPSSVYVKWSINTPTFNNSIHMTNTVDSTWVSDTILPNYPIGTKMYFKVFAVGNNSDTTETYQFMYTVKEFEYCKAKGNGNQLYLTKVSLANMTNITGYDAYHYFHDSTIYLELNTTYTLSLEPNTPYVSNNYFAWIDFDRDAVFDSSELVLSELTYNLSPVNGTFTVPADAVVYDTLWLRTRLTYWNTNYSPCDSTLGEVEDYPIIIRPTKPNLNFSLGNQTICQNDKIAIDYTGDALDSIQWTFSNGSNTYTSTSFNDSLAIRSSGTFNLHLVGYARGRMAIFDSLNSLVVLPSSSDTIRAMSCNVANVGTVRNTFTNSFGCDSVITTITTLAPSSNDTIKAMSCNAANIGTVRNTLTNRFGCDSIVTTITALLPSSSDTIRAMSCNAANVGTVRNTLTNSFGCDSVITTITTFTPINPTVNLHTDTLIANPSGLSYQWLDCNANFAIINGATSHIFVTGLNGSFAVEITNGSCIDTSACEQVIGLGIMSNNFDNEIKLYPNPTDGLVSIDMGIIYPKVKIIVTNELGQVLINKTIANNKMIAIDLESYTTGLYFVQLTAANKKATFKLIKK